MRRVEKKETATQTSPPPELRQQQRHSSPLDLTRSYVTSMLDSKPAKGVYFVGKLVWDIFAPGWFKENKSYEYLHCPFDLHEVEWRSILQKVRHYGADEPAKQFASQFQASQRSQTVADGQLLQLYAGAPQSFKDCLEFCIETMKNRPYGNQGVVVEPLTAFEIIQRNPRGHLVYRGVEIYLKAKEEDEFVDVAEGPEPDANIGVSWWQWIASWWSGD